MSSLPESRRSRRVAGIGAAGLAVFFAALVLVTLDTQHISGSVALAWMSRLFGVLVFGSISAALFVMAWRTWQGVDPAQSRAKPPSTLLSLCPGCGESVTDPDLCSRCKHPLHGLGERWITDSSLGTAAFALAAGAGLLALGIGVTAWPWVGTRAGVFLISAGVCVGLVVAVFAALVLFAGVQMFRDVMLGVRHWKYSWAFQTHQAEGTATVKAQTRKDELIRITGLTKIECASPELPTLFEPVSEQRPLARALRVLHEMGLARIWFEQRISWNQRDVGVPVERLSSNELMIALAKSSQGFSVPDDVHRVLAMLNGRVETPTSVASLWNPLATDAATKDVLRGVNYGGDEPSPLERMLLGELGRSVVQ